MRKNLNEILDAFLGPFLAYMKPFFAYMKWAR